MTCKDCIHYDVCGGYTLSDLDCDVFHYAREGRTDEIPDIEERCSGFKDKSRFVELPCKVGGIVYEVQELYERVQEYEVVSILYSNSGFSFGWNLKDGKGFYSNNVLGFTEREIGKTVFLTREEAEKALEGKT